MIRKLMLLLIVVIVIGVSGASASSITGFKFNDSNGNGTWDPIEHGLTNWTIILTTPDGSKITNTTNASGFYIFSNLPAGNYTLEEVLKPGWVRTFPKEPITKVNLSEGEDVNETGFGNMQVSQAVSNISASNLSAFNISGFKINGDTGKGIKGWNITLSNNTTQKSMQTGADGSYKFTGLLNGTYNVSEEMKPGFTPVGAMFRIITIENMDVMNVNFTNKPVVPTVSIFNISGFKINGATGEGIKGWNITLSNNTMQKSTLTGIDGSYQFTGLLNGTYNVTEGIRADFTPAGPTSQNVTVANQDITDINFTNMPVSPTPTPSQPSTPTPTTGSISGFKINDLNGNGKWDEGENGLSGWTIKLTGIVPETTGISKETTTDNQGFYKFDDLPAGQYLIEEKNLNDFVPTSSPVKTITLAQGENSINNNFTNRLVLSSVNIGNQVNIENKDLDNHGNIENKKDTDDHANINDNTDKGDQGNVKDMENRDNHENMNDNRGENIQDNKDINDHGNIKDIKDLIHKATKGKNDKNKGNKD